MIALGYVVLGWALGLLTAMVLGPFARAALRERMTCVHGDEPAWCERCPR